MQQMLSAIEQRLPRIDVLLFSDFNYGCLPQALVDGIREKASARKDHDGGRQPSILAVCGHFSL